MHSSISAWSAPGQYLTVLSLGFQNTIQSPNLATDARLLRISLVCRIRCESDEDQR